MGGLYGGCRGSLADVPGTDPLGVRQARHLVRLSFFPAALQVTQHLTAPPALLWTVDPSGLYKLCGTSVGWSPAAGELLPGRSPVSGGVYPALSIAAIDPGRDAACCCG